MVQIVKILVSLSDTFYNKTMWAGWLLASVANDFRYLPGAKDQEEKVWHRTSKMGFRRRFV
jgi:hypothetical protein